MDSTLGRLRPQKQTGEETDYLSFLLRLWRRPHDETTCRGEEESERGTGEPGWRASLEKPYTGERIGFGSVDELFDFLRAQVGLVPAVSKNQEAEGRDETRE